MANDQKTLALLREKVKQLWQTTGRYVQLEHVAAVAALYHDIQGLILDLEEAQRKPIEKIKTLCEVFAEEERKQCHQSAKDSAGSWAQNSDASAGDNPPKPG